MKLLKLMLSFCITEVSNTNQLQLHCWHTVHTQSTKTSETGHDNRINTDNTDLQCCSCLFDLHKEINLTVNRTNCHIGRPRPRPAGIPSPSADDLGFLTVSSTDKMRHAASDAAVRALILMTAGSQTHASKLSAMSSLLMSTPNHVPPACKSINRN